MIRRKERITVLFFLPPACEKHKTKFISNVASLYIRLHRIMNCSGQTKREICDKYLVIQSLFDFPFLSHFIHLLLLIDSNTSSLSTTYIPISTLTNFACHFSSLDRNNSTFKSKPHGPALMSGSVYEPNPPPLSPHAKPDVYFSQPLKM